VPLHGEEQKQEITAAATAFAVTIFLPPVSFPGGQSPQLTALGTT
jgi:hypothetical protein